MQNPELAQCLRDLRADPHNQSLKQRALDLMGHDDPLALYRHPLWELIEDPGADNP